VQLQAFNASGANVARGMPVTSLSAYAGYRGGSCTMSFNSDCVAAYAVTGDADQLMTKNIFYASDGTSSNEFWQVTLATPSVLQSVVFTNRVGDCGSGPTSCQDRATTQTLFLLGASAQALASLPLTAAQTQTFACANAAWVAISATPSPTSAASRSPTS
jgi:phage major head subunit gpT-like protein